MKRWMVLGLLACACGSSNDGNGGTPDSGTPHGSGSFTGTVNGHALTVNDAVFGNPNSGFVAIIASDQANLCTLLGGNTFPGGTVTVLGVAVANLTVPPANVVAGAYQWYPLQGSAAPAPGLYFDGAFALPTDCNGGGEAFVPKGGTVTITQLGTTSGTHLKATYSNVSFKPADGGTTDVGTLNGTIDAVYCVNAVANPNCGRLLLARPGASE
jgi:hypothetical protein